MANDLYPTARSRYAGALIDWDTDTFKLALLDDSYVYSAADEFAADLTGIITTVTMTGNAILADGVCDADDLSITGVSAGLTVAAVVIYKDTGSSATSPLIAFMDENDDTTPISRLTDGSAIPLIWSNSADRVFRL